MTRSTRRPTLVVYTDGVTEAHDSEREMFGRERLREAVQHRHAATADAVAQEIADAVQAFRGPAAQRDDITVTVVKRLAGE